MSESRYDSDAQFIATPRHDPTDSPAHRARRRVGLSDLIERSQEHREAERWATGYGDNIPEPPESAFGMRFIQTPPGSMRSRRSPYLNINDSVSSEEQQKHSRNSVSLPDLYSASQRRNGSVAGSCATVQNNHGGADQNHPNDSQSVEISSKKHGLDCPDSSSNQRSELIVPKRRQPVNSGVFLMDSHTVHLEDMGISHRLASQSASSAHGSCDPSVAEMIRSNRYGLFMYASQENMPIAQRSTTSITSGHIPQTQTYHLRDGSSFYSHQPSSRSAVASPCSNSFTFEIEQRAGKVNDSKHNLTAEARNDSAFRASSALSSKFREHCDGAVSSDSQAQIESTEGNGAGAPRKVSVGWMSGGRRVGYGYSPVPDDEVARYQQHGDAHPSLQQVQNQKAEIGMNEKNAQGGHAHQNHDRKADFMLAPGPTTPQSYSRSTSHHAPYPKAGPATLPRVRKSNHTSNEYPEPPYLRDILAGRYSQEHDREALLSKTQSTGSLCATAMPASSQSERCLVPQSAKYPSEQTEYNPSGGAGLSQSLKSNPQISKRKRGRRAGISDLSHCEKGQHIPSSEYNTVDIDPDYLGIEHDFNAEDVARLLRPSNPRGANWVRRLSKHMVNKRLSNAQQKGQSQTSLGLYQNRHSGSLERADSTKSIGTNAEELASLYQNCLEMPGSFEGSRWASRTSRMLWDLVTTDDR